MIDPLKITEHDVEKEVLYGQWRLHGFSPVQIYGSFLKQGVPAKQALEISDEYEEFCKSLEPPAERKKPFGLALLLVGASLFFGGIAVSIVAHFLFSRIYPFWLLAIPAGAFAMLWGLVHLVMYGFRE